MHRLIAWFVHNPVAANLLMMILIGGGLLALPRTHQEEFPTLEVDAIRISVPYLGAAPAEVESAVCVRVEEAVEGTEGIDKITSSASEGYCAVIIELVPGVDKTRVANDIKSKVDAIDSFPTETEQPVTAEISIIATVLQIAVSGRADERTLKLIGQQLRDDIAALPGVSQVQLQFARPYEISVEVSEQTLRRHGLTLQSIGRAIESSSLDIPGGALKTPGGEILLRTRGQAYTGREFEDIVVLTRRDGTSVTLGEIATVVDGFEDNDLRARFDGHPAVSLKVSRVGEEDIMLIADKVKAHLEQRTTGSARGHLDHHLAGRIPGPGRPPRRPDQKRPQRSAAGLAGTHPVPALPPRALGRRRHPGGDARHRGAIPGSGHIHQHHVGDGLHPGPGHPGG